MRNVLFISIYTVYTQGTAMQEGAVPPERSSQAVRIEGKRGRPT
jgi:hypothetical protein